jgi:hypothetical protein
MCAANTNPLARSLAAALEGNAEWREMKAAEYPEDERNEVAVILSKGLATEVRKRDDSDAQIRRLAALQALSPDLHSVGLENCDQVVSRIGFTKAAPSLETLLADLVDAAIDDYELFLDGNNDPSGPLALAQSDDPVVASVGIRYLRLWLADREEEVVAASRAAGQSWHQISRHLGRSVSALHERYSGRDLSVGV